MDGGQKRILIAEDDPAAREGLCALLGGRYEVHAARDGLEAIEKARALSPDLLLLEVFMPGADGLAALEALAADTRTEQIPVIFLSGSNGESVVRCLQRGAADYIRKPVGHPELIARIDRALRESDERKALRELAQTDGLTGLANYRSLVERAEHEYQRAVRYRHPISVVTIDLDRLKQLNDMLGHEVGNKAILELSRCLRHNLRECDFAARFGGDEFVVLLPHQTPSEAAILGERLRVGLHALPLGDACQAPVRLSISVGVAGHSERSPKESAAELLHASDLALYEAKRRGRNQVIVYQADLAHAGSPAHHHA